MGASASVSLFGGETEHRPTRKHQLPSRAEKILVSGKISNAVMGFQNHIHARLAFLDYLRSTNWLKDIELDRFLTIFDHEDSYEDISETYFTSYKMNPTAAHMIRNLMKSKSKSRKALKAQRVNESFQSSVPGTIVDHNDRELLSPEHSQNSQGSFNSTDLSTIVAKSHDDMLNVLCAVLLPLFTRYAANHASLLSGVSSTASDMSDLSDLPTIVSENESPIRSPKPMQVETVDPVIDEEILTMHKELIASIQDDDVLKIIQSPIWPLRICAFLEDYPISISVADASTNNRGFPILYVNRAFETTTGYKSSEIVGHKGKMLQCAATQEDKSRDIAQALREARPLKVTITNSKKVGADYENLLAFKPVRTSGGVYKYNICMQYDILMMLCSSDHHRVLPDLRRIDNMLYILPMLMSM